MYYGDYGHGKPVVLLHAFPLNRNMWDSLVRNLSQKARVIVPDFPGFGQTPVSESITMAKMAAEVARLLDVLDIREPIFLAGLSMGGYVAFEFFRQFSERVAGLGFFATRATADTDVARENRLKSIEAMERFGIMPFAKKAVKSQLSVVTQSENPQLIDTVLKLMETTPAAGAIEAQKAMASRRDSSDLLPLIKVPTLIVSGGDDVLSPPAEMQTIHKEISGSEFHIIPRVGHLINLENPQVFESVFKSFLEKTYF